MKRQTKLAFEVIVRTCVGVLLSTEALQWALADDIQSYSSPTRASVMAQLAVSSSTVLF